MAYCVSQGNHAAAARPRRQHPGPVSRASLGAHVAALTAPGVW
jgi:hypothetical protein